MAKNFIITRFCVITNSSFNAVKGQKDMKLYAQKMLSEESLSVRINLMRSVTAKSISNQLDFKNKSVWVVLVPDILPLWAFNELNEIGNSLEGVEFVLISVESGLGGSDKLDIEYGGSNIKNAINDYFVKVLSPGEVFITTRIDDDDALAENFLATVENYCKKEFVGMPITFPLGFEAIWSGGVLSDIKRLYFPMISVGLSLVSIYNSEDDFEGGQDIYSKGDHTKVDILNPMITDSRGSMFIRVLHGSNDSGGNQSRAYLNKPDVNDPGLTKFKEININLSGLSGVENYNYYRERAGINMLRETVAFSQAKMQLEKK